MRTVAFEAGCPEIITFLFSVESRGDISALFHRCSAYALNSNSDKQHTEGFGLTILEANCAGKLAVGSLSTGIEDAIEEGYSGYLVPQQDTTAIASALAKVFATDSVSAARHAKEFAQRFTWDKTVEGYIRAYTK